MDSDFFGTISDMICSSEIEFLIEISEFDLDKNGRVERKSSFAIQERVLLSCFEGKR